MWARRGYKLLGRELVFTDLEKGTRDFEDIAREERISIRDGASWEAWMLWEAPKPHKREGDGLRALGALLSSLRARSGSNCSEGHFFLALEYILPFLGNHPP